VTGFDENPSGETVPVALSKRRVSSCDPYLYHKTTHRAFYDDESRSARAAGLFERIFLNERGEVTEGTRTNVFVEAEGGQLETPPVSSGLLRGVLRQELIDTGRAREKVLSADDLQRARAFYVGNSVRGLIRARLVAGDE
jgi:branched-subunit amino acid aminotransferase/4-amino-4-deoxychorismate lyase